MSWQILFITRTEPCLQKKHSHAKSFFHILAVCKLEWEQKTWMKQLGDGLHHHCGQNADKALRTGALAVKPILD